jgi:hypothetical protein
MVKSHIKTEAEEDQIQIPLWLESERGEKKKTRVPQPPLKACLLNDLKSPISPHLLKVPPTSRSLMMGMKPLTLGLWGNTLDPNNSSVLVRQSGAVKRLYWWSLKSWYLISSVL